MTDKLQQEIDKATRSLTKARFQIITDKRLTFFSVVLMNLKLVPCTHIMSEDGNGIDDLDTAAVDGKHLFFNPMFINGLPPEQVKGVACHEVGHVTGFHFERMLKRKPKRWNVATDMKINSGLRDIKIELPPQAVYAEYQHNKMTCEQVYNVIEDPPGGGKGGYSDPSQCGVMISPRDDKGNKLSPSETRMVQASQRGVVEEAARMAKAQGSMPAFIEAMIQESNQEPLPWDEILRRFVVNHVKRDYTWRRPSRRMLGQNLYLPSQKVEGTGEVVVGIDTSGSITQADINVFAKNVQTIVDECMPDRIHVVTCDAAVHTAETFERGEEIKINLVGRGGTDFRPVFNWVEQSGVTPLCLIYFTDLQGSFPADPGYPTIWAATCDLRIPFGEKVMVNLKE